VRGALEKLIGADVRDGEWPLVLLFFANLFCLLAAYYILKILREPLLLLSGGAVQQSYARGVQAVLLALLVPVYGALANRFEPARLVTWIMSVFALCLVAFFAFGTAGVPVGFAFFVWLGMFATLSIAQFWSLANDVLTEEEGKRLFPLVAGGGTIGGIAGAQLAARTIDGHPFRLMLVAAVLLAGCAAMTHATHGVGVKHRGRKPDGPSKERDARGGFTLVLHDPYLLLVAASVLVLNLISTTGDFILAQLVTAKAQTLAVVARGHFISAFYGNLQTYVSVLTAGVQILVVSRIFNTVGIGGALLFMPLLAISGYGASAILPLLAVVTAVKVLENSTDHSLQNTVRQALFLPTSRDAKYKAKAAIDTVSVRLGDLTSAGLVAVGAQLGFTVFAYAMSNAIAGLVWIWIAVQLRRRQRALCAPPRLARSAIPELPVEG